MSEALKTLYTFHKLRAIQYSTRDVVLLKKYVVIWVEKYFSCAEAFVPSFSKVQKLDFSMSWPLIVTSWQFP